MKIKECVNCIDFNKAYPKDNYSLPQIDQFVNATLGHEFLTFTDVFLGYNQIRMTSWDWEHTSFIMNLGIYYYIVMSFGLKNTG